MIVEHTRTYLEMTDPDQLRPAAAHPAVRLEPVDTHDPRLQEVFTEVGSPHHWPGRVASAPHLRHWLVVVGDAPAGLSSLHTQPAGEVEVEAFGLVPARIGGGVGGAALTMTVRSAWQQVPVDGVPIHRVWLHTSSLDHPHALPNYLRRGFRTVRTEVRTKQVDDVTP